MALHRLQVLAPGKRCVGRNKDGSKRFIEFTPEYCREQYKRNSAMLQAGIPVPLSWEHRDDAKPGTISRDDLKSAKAKGVAGYVESYHLDGNKVLVDVEIPDEADAKQAKKVRFCSPEINTFTDGDGRDWGEVFTHVALTPRPVQHDQPPIARLSLTSTGPIRLAVDPEDGEDVEDEEKPAKKEGGGGDSDENETTLPEPSAAEGWMSKALGMLAKKGVVLPQEGNTPENVWERLCVALTAIEGAEESNTPPEEDPANVEPIANSAPIAMSHDAPPALKKQLALADALERKSATGRISRLVTTGRVTPEIGRKLASELGKIQLSFSDDGDLKSTDVHTKIEAYEALPKNTAWRPTAKKGVQLSHVDAVEGGLGQAGTPDGKSDEEFTQEWERTAGRKK